MNILLKNKINRESGSVFFYILIAIFLFATLTYILSDNSRTSASIVTEEQAKVFAQEIIEHSEIVSNTVQKLLLRGCDDIEISVQRDWNNNGSITNTVGDYYNANSPNDGSCNIYDNNGGGFIHQASQVGTYRISGYNRIAGFGCDDSNEDCIELTYANKDLPNAICLEINNLLGLTLTEIPSDGQGVGGFSMFDGFQTGGGTLIGDSDPNLTGLFSACYKDTDDGVNIFFRILIER